jgi:hypothetical protein
MPEIADMIVKKIMHSNPKSMKQVAEIIMQLEPLIIELSVNEAIDEILQWVEHQDKPDALQIYIQLKKLKEGKKDD